MAIIVGSVVVFFVVIALVAYLKKRNYHAPDLGGPDQDSK